MKKYKINYDIVSDYDIIPCKTKKEAFKKALQLHNEGIKNVEVTATCDDWEEGYGSLSTHYTINQIETELIIMEAEKELKRITKG